MKTQKRTTYMLILALLAAGYFAFPPTMKAAEPSTGDSEQVSKLLADAHSEAHQLQLDAEQMESFARGKLSWETHVGKVAEIKDHVNKMGDLVAKLGADRETALPWQQQAIDRITPLLKEMAANTESAIEYLNNNPGRLHTEEYKKYLVSNYDVSRDLAALVGDFVQYGKSKASVDHLGEKLEVKQ